jgi:hypothetical protein
MSSIPAKASMRERATTELREFVVIAAYLTICFSALAYLKPPFSRRKASRSRHLLSPR